MGWPGVPFATAAGILYDLTEAGLPHRDAALMWLAWGAAAASAEFLTALRQAAGPGLPANIVAALTERQLAPAEFASGLQTLELLTGSLDTALQEAELDHTLLRLPPPSNEIVKAFGQLRAARCTARQLVHLAKAAMAADGAEPTGGYSPTLAPSLTLLFSLLDSWPAAVEAATGHSQLLFTRAPSEAACQVGEQLRASLSTDRLDSVLVLLLRLSATEGAELEALLPLRHMLGSWEAALAAAASDVRLLRLPTGPAAEETARQLGASGVAHGLLLQLLSAELKHQLASPALFSSLHLLRELLGGWQEAVEAAAADRKLLRLPAASDATLEVARQLCGSGLSQQQLLALINGVSAQAADAGNRMDPEDPLASLQLLRLLLGSWRAAGEAVLADGGLLHLAQPSAEQHEILGQLATCRLSQIQLFQVAQLLSVGYASVDNSLQALSTARLIFGGSWKAAAEAALADIGILDLPPACEGVQEVGRQLDAVGYSHIQRLQLAIAATESRTGWAGSLQLLSRLLGSWRAAFDAAVQDGTLLDLPTGDDAQVCRLVALHECILGPHTGASIERVTMTGHCVDCRWCSAGWVPLSWSAASCFSWPAQQRSRCAPATTA